MEKYTAKFILIHVGYHKTGSTFLQKLIFCNPQHGFSFPWERPDFFERFILVNPFTFDPKESRKFFDTSILDAWSSSLVPVISEEALSGNIYKGEYNSRVIADRLFATFPEGRVLIVIREQTDMILSIYKHRVRSNLTVSMKDYLEQKASRSAFEPLFRLEYLEYHWLIDYYYQLFGKQNVLVLPYEMLKHDSSEFLKHISSFTETKILNNLSESRVNPGYSAFTLSMKRWFNMLYQRHPKPEVVWYQQFINSAFYHINNVIPKSLTIIFEEK